MFGRKKVMIGVLHLPPLPGSPLYKGNKIEEIIHFAIKEAKKLKYGGVDGIIIENYGDMTYFPGKVGPETVSSMTRVITELSKILDIPFGVCVLTDPFASLAIAHATKASFIRATVFTEAVMDVSGIIIGCAHQLLRFHKLINAENVKVFADLQVKHSVPISPKSIEDSARDAVYFQADALIVTGSHTGLETPLDKVKKVKEALKTSLNPKIPLFVGSGVNKNNVKELLKYADGVIVGTSLKIGNKTTNPIDIKKVKELAKVVKELNF
jgi:membrane complex biogenesis BtpA family protein